jgi:hypothetical protein
MSTPDIHALAARRVHNLPDNWQPRIYESLDRGLGFVLRGSVPVGTYSRGPRKGRPKWPPLGQLQRVVVTADEVRQEQIRWEHETGLCCRCGGTGQTVQSISVQNGTTYRQCIGCEGAGTASQTTEIPVFDLIKHRNFRASCAGGGVAND